MKTLRRSSSRFNPHPMRGNTPQPGPGMVIPVFQSTPPVRGATAKTAKKFDRLCKMQTFIADITSYSPFISKYIPFSARKLL